MVSLAEYKQAELKLDLHDMRRGWYIHALVYVLVNTGLVALNLILLTQTDESFLWFPFPLVGWGIGLFNHYLHAIRRAEKEIRVRQAYVEGTALQG
jgi:hypothetical protein